MRYSVFIVFSSLLLLNFSDGTLAQVKGVVMDQEKNIPIEFANIAIADSPVGVMANKYGNFQLFVPKNYAEKNIIVSCVGYLPDTIYFPYPNKQIIVTLKRSNIFLNEISVKPPNPIEILQKAIRKISHNYSNKTVNINAYYREIVKTDSLYVKYADAACILQYCGYNIRFDKEEASKKFNHLDYSKWNSTLPLPQAKLSVPHQCDLAKIEELRKSDNLESFKNRWGFEESLKKFGIGGGPLHLTSVDIVKLRKEIVDSANWKYYDFKYKGCVDDKNKKLYKISFAPISSGKKAIWTGTVYIEKDSHAFTRIEMIIPKSHIKHIEANIEQVVELKGKTKRKMKKQSVKRQLQSNGRKIRIDYSEYNNKWYLTYIQVENSYKNVGDLFDEINYKTFVELYINNIQVENITPFKEAELFYTNMYNLLFQNKSNYTIKFWRNYNTPLPNDLYKDALIEISKRKSLENQFLNNSEE